MERTAAPDCEPDLTCGCCQEHGLGELYVAGDHACEHGDVSALARIAQHLVEHVGEPLHCELLPLVGECADGERAAQAWTELKQRLVRA